MARWTLFMLCAGDFALAKYIFRYPMLALDDARRIPHDASLEFAHMTKDRNAEPSKVAVSKPESIPDTSSDNAWSEDLSKALVPVQSKEVVPYEKEGSRDVVPLADMQKPIHNNMSNTTTSNTDATHHANDNSRSYSNTFHKGGSTYTGDTSTYVTNNFYNPEPDYSGLGSLPNDAKLEYKYLWKRIDTIDDKLNKMEPLVLEAGQELSPIKRRGLVISFDADSEPENPKLSVNTSDEDL
ncbi:hypothetical protein BdWA1_001174 [Babesia duncani]|uniref:Uncharacterized protein n=1 Tax=Babesia duncani TaxID=323732 RepID=A0AAD9PNY3_9APIC|nr:hypothetical protein BdWA1_001174 [Babesia duncani]